MQGNFPSSSISVLLIHLRKEVTLKTNEKFIEMLHREEWSIRKPSEDCWLLGYSTLPPVFLANLGQHPCYGVSTHEKKSASLQTRPRKIISFKGLWLHTVKSIRLVQFVQTRLPVTYLHFWEIELGGSAIGNWEMKLLANGFVWKLA